MLSCKEVSKLTSEALDHKLTMWQTINVWMHLLMCGLCWGFRKDLVHLNRELKSNSDDDALAKMEVADQLSESSKMRMKELLKNQ